MRRHNGFTLLEVLVAMAVLAISLTIIMELFSGGLKSSLLSKKYVDAVYLAREKMETVLAKEGLAEQTEEGESKGGFTWRAVVLPAEESEEIEEAAPQLPYSLFEIRVNVMWKEGEHQKSYMIHTFKLATKKENLNTLTRIDRK